MKMIHLHAEVCLKASVTFSDNYMTGCRKYRTVLPEFPCPLQGGELCSTTCPILWEPRRGSWWSTRPGL